RPPAPLARRPQSLAGSPGPRPRSRTRRGDSQEARGLMTRTTTGLAIAAALLTLGAARAHAQDDCVTIADFAANPVGAFPSDWKVRKDEGKSVYTVQEEGGRRFLQRASKGIVS